MPCLPNIISQAREGPRIFLIKAIATGLGVGYIPFASGTFGTLLAIPLCFLLYLGGQTVYVIGTLAISAGAIWIAAEADRTFGVHDSHAIVIDEICGYLFTMALVPLTLMSIVAGFIIFRIFDIIKPFPAGWIDKNVPGGWGVMLDDLVAGVYSNLSLWGVLWIANTISPGV